MSYTKNDWTDILPAAVKAKLDLAETGIKYVNDERDKETAPGRALVEAATASAQRMALGLGTAALAGDASEGAKGVVQLASIGVPSATKVPKALGADLVALITAAGYSLAPAEGAASLDGIADGETYARTLAAGAAVANGIGLEDGATTREKTISMISSGGRFRFGVAAHLIDTYDLTYKDLGAANTMYPLEHLMNRGRAGFYSMQDAYFLVNGANIYKTTDGETFTLVAKLNTIFGGSNWIQRQLTAHTGVHVVFNSGTSISASGTIEVYASDYATRSDATDYDWAPYNTHGIDENPFTKTICYAEYPDDTALTASIWRSVSPYTTWTKVFTQNAWGYGVGRDIRHFHICAADPFVSGKWYASSGDDPDLCNFYESVDDGITWTKIISGDSRVRSVQYSFDSTYIYWSEDNINGGFYKMDKTTHEITTIIAKNVMSGLGYSCIPCPYGWILFFEKTAGALDETYSYIYMVDPDGELFEMAKMKIGFTAFKSPCVSPQNGKFYSQVISSNPLWTSRTGVFQILSI